MSSIMVGRRHWSARRGLYPKLQVTIPSRPVPARLLGSCQWLSMESLTIQNELSSAPSPSARSGHRCSIRLRWRTPRTARSLAQSGYSTFARCPFALLSSRKRKAIARNVPAALRRLDILPARREIMPEHWSAMWHFDQDTGQRKWGQPISPALFDKVGAVMGDASCCSCFETAADRGRAQFHRCRYAYGRMGRGGRSAVLHFELSIYRASRVGRSINISPRSRHGATGRALNWPGLGA